MDRMDRRQTEWIGWISILPCETTWIGRAGRGTARQSEATRAARAAREAGLCAADAWRRSLAARGGRLGIWRPGGWGYGGPGAGDMAARGRGRWGPGGGWVHRLSCRSGSRVLGDGAGVAGGGAGVGEAGGGGVVVAGGVLDVVVAAAAVVADASATCRRSRRRRLNPACPAAFCVPLIRSTNDPPACPAAGGAAAQTPPPRALPAARQRGRGAGQAQRRTCKAGAPCLPAPRLPLLSSISSPSHRGGGAGMGRSAASTRPRRENSASSEARQREPWRREAER